MLGVAPLALPPLGQSSVCVGVTQASPSAPQVGGEPPPQSLAHKVFYMSVLIYFYLFIPALPAPPPRLCWQLGGQLGQLRGGSVHRPPPPQLTTPHLGGL